MKFETQRLMIRTFTKEDLSEFKKLLNIKEVEGWMMQRERAEEFLDWIISNYIKMDIIHGVVCFGIFSKTSDEVLGAVAAGEHDDLHETEIAYNLLESARGLGYAAEACSVVTAWALENYDIPYIIGTAFVDNLPSQKVLERCGYEYINEQELLVHITNKRYRFKYYRHYTR
jgi:[ribosomal protein S5]-alanine N-acetyltransferase